MTTREYAPRPMKLSSLTAAFQDGVAVRGESAITARGGRIRRLTLDRPVRPLPETIEAIVNADLIVVGPGSLYTSIVPNLLIDGVAATIAAVNVPRVYVANLMTEPGETDGYSLGDHLRALREHTGFDLFDYVLVNGTAIPDQAVQAYAADGSHLVSPIDDDLPAGAPKIVAANLATITSSGQIRHDPAKLGLALTALLDCSGARPAGGTPHQTF